MTTGRHDEAIRGQSDLSNHMNPEEEPRKKFGPARESDVQQGGKHGPRSNRDRRHTRAVR